MCDRYVIGLLLRVRMCMKDAENAFNCFIRREAEADC